MWNKYAVIAVSAILLSVMAAGCAASTDPLVGQWKQDVAGIVVTMDLKEGGTGTMTMDMSAIFQGASDTPASETTPLTWKKVNDTCIEVRLVNETSSASSDPALFNYDEGNKHIWDTSGSTRLDFYKQ